MFSLGANGVGVNRPGRNGTYVRFMDATLNNTQVLAYDCGWSTMVTYSGSTIIIYAPFPWQPGHRYYVTFDSGESTNKVIMMSMIDDFSLGASSGVEFCRKCRC